MRTLRYGLLAALVLSLVPAVASARPRVSVGIGIGFGGGGGYYGGGYGYGRSSVGIGYGYSYGYRPHFATSLYYSTYCPPDYGYYRPYAYAPLPVVYRPVYYSSYYSAPAYDYGYSYVPPVRYYDVPRTYERPTYYSSYYHSSRGGFVSGGYATYRSSGYDRGDYARPVSVTGGYSSYYRR